MRVESVNAEPVMGLDSLQAAMEAQQSAANNSSAVESADANRFDILGANSFASSKTA